MIVLGRYIDAKAWHVVITRSGDVVRHNRFAKQADADAFVSEVAEHLTTREARRGYRDSSPVDQQIAPDIEDQECAALNMTERIR